MHIFIVSFIAFIFINTFLRFLRVYRLIVHILAGQEKFRAMTPMYYRNANAALLCFDLTNYKSFLDVKDWVQELHKYVISIDISCKLSYFIEKKIVEIFVLISEM